MGHRISSTSCSVRRTASTRARRSGWPSSRTGLRSRSTGNSSCASAVDLKFLSLLRRVSFGIGTLVKDKIIIAGGGPVGLIIGLILGRAGADVTVLDQGDIAHQQPRAATIH